MIAEIETERLRLTAPQEIRFARYAEIWAMPDVTRFVGGRVRSIEKCREVWERNLVEWQTRGFGNWLVVEKASDATLGQVGFFVTGRGFGAHFDQAVEAGWVLDTATAGKGYGRECVLAAHDWWDRQAFRRRTVCMIDPENLPSIKLAERAGYSEYMRADYEGDELILMERI